MNIFLNMEIFNRYDSFMTQSLDYDKNLYHVIFKMNKYLENKQTTNKNHIEHLLEDIAKQNDFFYTQKQIDEIKSYRYIGKGLMSECYEKDNIVYKLQKCTLKAFDDYKPYTMIHDFEELMYNNSILKEDYDTKLIALSRYDNTLLKVLKQPYIDKSIINHPLNNQSIRKILIEKLAKSLNGHLYIDKDRHYVIQNDKIEISDIMIEYNKSQSNINTVFNHKTKRLFHIDANCNFNIYKPYGKNYFTNKYGFKK